MKIKINDLRQIVREEILKGMPQFVVNEATTKYIQEIRSHIRKFVEQNSRSANDARYVMEEAEKILKELEEDIVELTNDRLHRFINLI